MRVECTKGERASSRMLKKAASGVLASLRGSTYRSVRLASSFVAALLDSLFEHPAKELLLHRQTSEAATVGLMTPWHSDSFRVLIR